MRIAVLALLLVAGCQSPAPEPAPAQPAAVVIAELRPGAPLEEMLHLLERELVIAINGDMEGAAVDHLRRAEAISDRLLEARQPFEWITAEQYSVQARLRQIQSGADRVMARYQTGAPRDSMVLDLRALRAEVLRLRQALSHGGSRAPTPLQQLLLADSVRRTAPRPAAPTPAAQSRPDTVPLTTRGE
jgi:hypothetical protein